MNPVRSPFTKAPEPSVLYLVAICTASERIGVDRIKTELDELLNDFQDKAGGLYGICLKAAAKAVGEDSAKIAKEIWSAAGALSGTDGTESLIREKVGKRLGFKNTRKRLPRSLARNFHGIQELHGKNSGGSVTYFRHN